MPSDSPADYYKATANFESQRAWLRFGIILFFLLQLATSAMWLVLAGQTLWHRRMVETECAHWIGQTDGIWWLYLIAGLLALLVSLPITVLSLMSLGSLDAAKRHPYRVFITALMLVPFSEFVIVMALMGYRAAVWPLVYCILGGLTFALYLLLSVCTACVCNAEFRRRIPAR